MKSESHICPKCLQRYQEGEERCATDSRMLLKMDSSESRRVGEVLSEGYTLLGLLGKGGMGAVYRALQHSMEREVAIKLLHATYAENEQAVQRFMREAKQASRLNHPNIITLFDFGKTQAGELYLVMELLVGQPLGALISRREPMEPARAVNLVGQICDALEHAHNMELIHRDLKPENVFVTRGAGQGGEFIKVIDFGLAKVRSEGMLDTLTTEGAVCGTPAYMSPEQALSRELTPTSDVYSIAIILYELLAGVRPFRGGSPLEVLMARIQKPPASVREAGVEVKVPEALEEVLMEALSKDPGERPATAAEFKRELELALGQNERQPRSRRLARVDTSVGAERTRSRALEGVATTLDSSFPEVVLPDQEGATAPAKSRSGWWLAAGGALVVAGVLYVASQSTSSPAPPAPVAPASPVAAKSSAPKPAESVDKPETATPQVAKDDVAPSSPPAVAPQLDKIEEAPATPAPVKTIHLTTAPVGAKVKLGEKSLGETPLVVPLPAPGGDEILRIERKGYRSVEQTLSAGARGPLHFELKKLPAAKKIAPAKKSSAGEKKKKPLIIP